MTIEPYVPSYQIIPTDLRLKVSNLPEHPDIQIVYERSPEEFAYVFTFYHVFLYQENTLQVCEEILDRIVKTLCNQSYDHGASWCETSRQMLSDSDESSTIYKVNFRIRDAG